MNIYCFRKLKRITREIVCRGCLFRHKCRPFQLWLQPELPFVFKISGDPNAVFDLQNDMQNALDALYPSERRILQQRALKALPGIDMDNRIIVRLKMFELMQNGGKE